MNKTLRTIGIASLFLGGIAATSPLYAHQKAKPAMDHTMMQNGGNMGGMDMMGMMVQMNKMMGLCSKMMEMAMNTMGDSGMQMPKDGETAPEKKN